MKQKLLDFGSKLFSLGNNEQIDAISLDDILTNKIKFGKSQFIILTCLLILNMADGAETMIIGFLQPQIKKEWNVSDTLLHFNIIFIFLGITLGALFTGKISDSIGRRKPLLLATIGTFTSAIFSSMAQSYFTYILTRGIFGFFMGSTMVVFGGYTGEILPKNLRAKWFAYIAYGFCLGQILGLALAYMLLDTFETGNWRTVLVLAAIPSFIALPLCYKFVPESPRFLLIITNQKKKAIDILEHMNFQNNHDSRIIPTPDIKKQYQLTQQEKKSLEKWADFQHKSQSYKKAKLSELFTPQYKKTTVFLSLVWLSLSLIVYGVNISIPSIIYKINQQNLSDNNDEILQEDETKENQLSNHDYMGISLSIISQMVAILLIQLIIENKNFGRKNLVFGSYLIVSLMSFFIFLSRDINIIFYLSISILQFFMYINVVVLYIWTAELFQTSIRITGVGFTNSIARVGGMLISVIMAVGFYFFGNFGPFFMFALFALISAYGAYNIPRDTTDIQLDIQQFDQQEQLQQQQELSNVQKQPQQQQNYLQL